MKPMRSLGLISLLCVALLDSGCGGPTLRMNIVIESGANDNSPILMSVVAAYSLRTAGTLFLLSTKQWFARRESLLREYPDDLEEIYFEFVPGQPAGSLVKSLRRRPLRCVLFTNYQSAGQKRQELEINKSLQLTLGLRDVTVKR